MIKLVIANRGEIARRILKTAKERGYCVAVVATPDDMGSCVCREADAVLEVSHFLNGSEIVKKSLEFGARFLHPGYGFLSERSDFAHLVEEAGIGFVGPTSENMKLMGSKESSKKIAQQCQVPTLNALLSHELKQVPNSQWKKLLDEKGILSPYLVKASGGGGGRGMRIVENFNELSQTLLRASEEAKSAFGDETVFVERYLKNPRHIEIQVFGDGKGGGVFWGERECSLQRRHQKVIEEAPSSFVTPELREKMGRASLNLVKETKYRGAGTCEYLVDNQGNFYFLEMNTRLQVEHPVTEMVYGINLVDAQFELATGNWPPYFPNPNEFFVPIPKGVSLEARILAEDSRNNFFPTPGKISVYQEPQEEGVRIDTGVNAGDVVNPNFDSMISKLIVHAPSRLLAIKKMKKALENYVILGFITNINFLKNIVSHPDFLVGNESTGWIEENLSFLNAPILSHEQMNFFHSHAFQERLSLSLNNNVFFTPVQKVFSLLTLNNLSQGFELAPAFCRDDKGSTNCFLLKMDPGLRRDDEGTALSSRGEPTWRTEFTSANAGAAGSILFFATRISAWEIHLFCSGESIIFSCPRKVSLKLNQEGSLEGKLKTPMPGKLFEVLVKEGNNVSAGQVLFIVESMKMQLEVKSSMDGKIEKIYFEKGQNLVGSDIIAEIVAS